MPISHNHDDADDSLDSAKAIELENQVSISDFPNDGEQPLEDKRHETNDEDLSQSDGSDDESDDFDS